MDLSVSPYSKEELDDLPNRHEAKLPVVLDVVSGLIDEYRALVAERQNVLANVMKGRSVLVFDAGFGVPTVNLQGRLRYLGIDGISPVADLIRQKLFRGSIPRNSSEVMQGYLGEEVRVHHHDVRYQRYVSASKVGAVVFSGSPANVNYEDSQDSSLGRYTSLGSKEVVERAREFHKMCMDEGVPVIALCFGFHLVSKLLGGDVSVMEEDRYGMENIVIPQQGEVFLRELFDDSYNGGNLYVSHGQKAILNSKASFEFSEVEDDGVKISHGSVNVDPCTVELSENPWRSAAKISQLMEDSQYVSLTLQAHPELTFVHLLLQYLIENESLAAYEMLIERIGFVRGVLDLVTKFFQKHKRLS